MKLKTNLLPNVFIANTDYQHIQRKGVARDLLWEKGKVLKRVKRVQSVALDIYNDFGVVLWITHHYIVD